MEGDVGLKIKNSDFKLTSHQKSERSAMDSPLYFFTIPQGRELFNVYNKHTICQHCVHSLPAEVWSVVAVFREDDVVGGIGEVGVAKVVFVTPGDLTAKSFRCQTVSRRWTIFGLVVRTMGAMPASSRLWSFLTCTCPACRVCRCSSACASIR